MSLIYGYSAEEDCETNGASGGGASGAVFKKAVGSFVFPTGGGKRVEVISGWNDIPVGSTIIFVLVKSQGILWVRLENNDSSTLVNSIPTGNNWGGKVAILNRHNGKMFAYSISGLPPTIVKRTVEIKFVYVEQ